MNNEVMIWRIVNIRALRHLPLIAADPSSWRFPSQAADGGLA
jgi:hypothetical protein